MNISQEEAANALGEIEASRTAMRAVIRNHRGHLYLWLWGSIWIVNSLLNGWSSARFWNTTNWITLAGLLATAAIIVMQRRQVRSRLDRRFVAVCGTLLVFGYGVWPFVLGGIHSYTAAYAFGMLIWMQVYVVAGIWFDNYWLWIGLVVAALILAGFLLFPGAFWAFSLLGGATLLGTGFYVRLCWR
jgi:hypothetical protein